MYTHVSLRRRCHLDVDLIHKVMKKKIDVARSSAERDLTISTTKQIEVLWERT